MVTPNDQALIKLAAVTGETPDTVASWFQLGPRILRVPDVADLLGVSPHLVGKLFREGQIPAKKVGREWRTTDHAVAQWLASDGEPTPLVMGDVHSRGSSR